VYLLSAGLPSFERARLVLGRGAEFAARFPDRIRIRKFALPDLRSKFPVPISREFSRKSLERSPSFDSPDAWNELKTRNSLYFPWGSGNLPLRLGICAKMKIGKEKKLGHENRTAGRAQ
jgi:hypothetical protein